MTHTIESLCSLLNADGVPINAEAEQQLRIWTAEADGWEYLPGQLVFSRIIIKDEYPWTRQDYRRRTDSLDWYPTSLDAIYAAEKRAGLHDSCLTDTRREWSFCLFQLARRLYSSDACADIAKLSPAARCIAFILTRQHEN